jgi:hypothetical protein
VRTASTCSGIGELLLAPHANWTEASTPNNNTQGKSFAFIDLLLTDAIQGMALTIAL